MFSIPLKYRITAAIFSLTAIILAIVLSQALSQYFQGIHEQITQQEQASLKLLGEFAHLALLTTDYEAFQPQLEQVSNLPSVSEVLLADSRGIIVAASNPVWVGQSLSLLTGLDGKEEWRTLVLENVSGPLGTLVARFSDDALMALHNHVRSLAFGWSLVGLLLIALASILVVHLLTRRLERVTRAAMDVANGDLSARARVNGHDEVAELGRVFDSMVQRINDNLTELEKREQHLSLTLDSIGDAVITTDASGCITRKNPVAESMTGWESKDAYGHHLPEVFHIINAHTRLPVANPVEKVLATGNVVGLANHTVLISKDGTEYQIADSAAPIKGKNGEILGVILVFRDVTRQYQTEEALRRSQKMEAIGQLSGGIAHDFNNLLGVIIGYLDFLRNIFPEGDKARNYVDTATKATLRCTDLTRQLLAVSRLETETKQSVNLNAALRDMEAIVARSITPEVELEYVLAENLWLTETAPGEFQDVILNLVINARDAMPRGGKLVIQTSNTHLDEEYVSCNPGIEAGDYVQLMLSDTGMGMDKKTLEHIFEPFFTTKSNGKGTGLGLAMVYGFAKRNNGHIKVYSELGVGTVFSLYLPRSMASEADVIVNSNPDADFATGNESILIVDDEVDLLKLTNQYLSDLGYRTFMAKNATQALGILANEKNIDLLFSDVVMPGGMNGYELAQQATLQRPSLKVLLTSGFTSETIAQNGLEKFSVHLLRKPYRRTDLAQRIRLVLDETSSA